jgi:hypothetical protein
MNGLEDRLRDAYRGAAQSVPPDTMPIPRWREQIRGDEGRARRPGRPGTARWLVPLAAAVAVVVAIGVAAAVTALAPGRAGGTGPAGGRSGGSPAAGAVPRFMVMVVEPNTTPGGSAVPRSTGCG